MFYRWDVPVRHHWQNYEKSLEVPKSFRFKFLIYGNLSSYLQDVGLREAVTFSMVSTVFYFVLVG